MVEPIINTINLAAPSTGSFLVDIILWLVKGTSSVALGVVLFTIILKIITLPFDFISRSSMRKNSIKMEEMRPELEKLQKQYADNKDLYNQKMMALYKKNGYSMFGSCLPTIITLVIFIVAINAFNDYSRFQNHEYFYDMTVSYNSVLYKGLETDEEYIKIDENGTLIVDKEKILADATARTEDGKEIKVLSVGEGENAHEIIVEKIAVKQEGYPDEIEVFSTKNSYVYYYEESNGRELFIAKETGLTVSKLASSENNFLKNAEGKNFEEAKAAAAANGDESYSETKFLQELCEQRSADTFNNNGSSFLWVKNIWVSDTATAHPVESFNDFNNKHGHREGGSCSCNGKVTTIIALEEDYNNLTAKLGDKKSAPNGYYIFVILTAGISLLTQLVMSKGQKAQMELQTVDGQGAQTQKMMMWMMPIMMAVFAFMYTAAFSIYIVLSSLISMLSTIVINKIVDKKYKTKKNDSEVIRSKKVIREAEEEKKAAEERKNKPKKKKDEPETGDFLSGEADKKKHVRGRLK